MKTLPIALLFALALLIPQASARAALTPEQFLRLAEAYQGGYLQLLAASALQIHSTAGLVATDFSAGRLDGPLAADALSDTQLLHGVCYATLLEVQQATPKDDKAADARIGGLAAVLVAEQALLLALQDVFSNPTPKNAERVNLAKDNVAQLLDTMLD